MLLVFILLEILKWSLFFALPLTLVELTLFKLFLWYRKSNMNVRTLFLPSFVSFAITLVVMLLFSPAFKGTHLSDILWSKFLFFGAFLLLFKQLIFALVLRKDVLDEVLYLGWRSSFVFCVVLSGLAFYQLDSETKKQRDRWVISKVGGDLSFLVREMKQWFITKQIASEILIYRGDWSWLRGFLNVKSGVYTLPQEPLCKNKDVRSEVEKVHRSMKPWEALHFTGSHVPASRKALFTLYRIQYQLVLEGVGKRSKFTFKAVYWPHCNRPKHVYSFVGYIKGDNLITSGLIISKEH